MERNEHTLLPLAAVVWKLSFGGLAVPVSGAVGSVVEDEEGMRQTIFSSDFGEQSIRADERRRVLAELLVGGEDIVQELLLDVVNVCQFNYEGNRRIFARDILNALLERVK